MLYPIYPHPSPCPYQVRARLDKCGAAQIVLVNKARGPCQHYLGVDLSAGITSRVLGAPHGECPGAQVDLLGPDSPLGPSKRKKLAAPDEACSARQFAERREIAARAEMRRALSQEALVDYWAERFPSARAVLPISALSRSDGADALLDQLIDLLPESPPYFPKDQLTDRPERFFAAEMVR